MFANFYSADFFKISTFILHGKHIKAGIVTSHFLKRSNTAIGYI